jgi:hypothetical protein
MGCLRSRASEAKSWGDNYLPGYPMPNKYDVQKETADNLATLRYLCSIQAKNLELSIKQAGQAI